MIYKDENATQGYGGSHGAASGTKATTTSDDMSVLTRSVNKTDSNYQKAWGDNSTQRGYGSGDEALEGFAEDPEVQQEQQP